MPTISEEAKNTDIFGTQHTNHYGTTALRAKPIVILGAAHSGTTILHKMLAMSPELAWFSQFSQRGGMVEGRRPIPFSNHLDGFLRSAFAYDWRKEEGKSERFFVPRPGEANQIWEYIIPFSNAVSAEESIRRMRQIFEFESRFWKTPFVITKLPWLYQHIELIRAAYPHTMFVHIVRDGRAVALSFLDKYRRQTSSEAEGVEAAAQYWVDVIEEVNKHRSASPMFELRYEDFCADVHGHLKAILSTIGLRLDKFPFHRCPRTLQVTNAKRLDAASSEQLRLMEQRQRYQLAAYGYVPA